MHVDYGKFIDVAAAAAVHRGDVHHPAQAGGPQRPVQPHQGGAIRPCSGHSTQH